MNIIKSIKVKNMESANGNSVPNQFIIRVKTQSDEQVAFDRAYFQSYNSIIAMVDVKDDTAVLDATYWNYSRTTSKYRNIFLGESTAETQKKINTGEYKLADLN